MLGGAYDRQFEAASERDGIERDPLPDPAGLPLPHSGHFKQVFEY